MLGLSLNGESRASCARFRVPATHAALFDRKHSSFGQS